MEWKASGVLPETIKPGQVLAAHYNLQRLEQCPPEEELAHDNDSRLLQVGTLISTVHQSKN
jgi:hypothetical protein